MLSILTEDRNLYRGIFWIPDIDNIYNSDLYFQIPCDSYGNIDSNFNLGDNVSSKNRDNYNHKNLWNSLPSKITKNKSFDYYPRGRVEINNGIAIIYHSPYIPQDELKQWVTDKFNLTKINGIKKIRLIADGSNHYHCYLDD